MNSLAKTVVFAGLAGLSLSLLIPAQGQAGPSPETRALAYLSGEVPRWSRENGCFSCHNNGDGARALYTALRAGVAVDPSAVADTTGWLRRPSEWSNHKTEVAYADSRVARIQFAASLAAAHEAGLADRDPLEAAASTLLADQQADGSWQVGAGDSLGSPVTYGTCLATYTARRVLLIADAARFAGPVARAEQWLARTPFSAIIDAAAVALALADRESPDAKSQVKAAVELVMGAQASDGGWGPYRSSPSEVFDTAMALLALAPHRDRAGVADKIERGRRYLADTQLGSGGWTSTTRPPGAQSYAQHISTTAWAVMALLATDR